jgi:hypothetical protein
MSKKHFGGKQNRGVWKIPTATQNDGKQNNRKSNQPAKSTQLKVNDPSASQKASAGSGKSLSESLFDLTNPMPKASME